MTEPEVVSAELVVQDGSSMTVFGVEQGNAVIERAAAMAAPLKKVIEDQHLYASMGFDRKANKEKRHVTVEGWTLLGSMVGVHPHTVQVERMTQFDDTGKVNEKDAPILKEREIGWRAVVETRRLDGTVMSTAESYCMRDEDRWGDRPSFQLASMAQTRATAKAMRQALSFVMVLAGYNPTPAEEINAGEEPLAAQIQEALELGFEQAEIIDVARKYTKERGGENPIRNLKVLSKAPDEYLDEVLRRLKATQDFGGEDPATPPPDDPTEGGFNKPADPDPEPTGETPSK